MPNRNVGTQFNKSDSGDIGNELLISGKKRKMDNDIYDGTHLQVSKTTNCVSRVNKVSTIKSRRDITKTVTDKINKSTNTKKTMTKNMNADRKVLVKKTTTNNWRTSKIKGPVKHISKTVSSVTVTKKTKSQCVVSATTSKDLNRASIEKVPKKVTKITKKVANVKTKPKSKAAGKKFGFWRGPRLRRMASLNAQAKVHILYENEARSPLGGQVEDSAMPIEAPMSIAKKKKTTVATKRNDLKSIQDASKIVSKVVKKRKPTSLSDDIRFQVSTPKRMASLNAQAILAASYSMDRSRKEKPVTVAIEKPVVPIMEVMLSSSKSNNKDREDVDTILEVINTVASAKFMDNIMLTKSKMKNKIIDTTEETNRPLSKVKICQQSALKKTLRSTSTSTSTSTTSCTSTSISSASGTSVIPLSPRSKADVIHQRLTLEATDVSLPTEVCSMVVVDDAPLIVSHADVGTTFDGSNRDDNYEKVVSPTVGFIPMEDNLDVKSEAIRRDKIEDTAEVTITGMYINPVTNTSQSFCISRIHTYKQATSTHSCYSPPPNASTGIVGDMQTSQSTRHPPSTATHLGGSSAASASSGTGLLHGGHVLHGNQGLYPYATVTGSPSHQTHGIPHGDVAGIARHYGSAFTVPNYGHHQPLPYGYYQPAGPMIQTVTTDPNSCLIHKPVPFHPSSSHSFQQQHQQSAGSMGQTQQPFPVDQCRARPSSPPYPPTGPGPGPGRQQQVYAGGGGGGGLVISSSSTAPASSTISSPSSSPRTSAAASSSTTVNRCGGSSNIIVATTDECKSSGRHVIRASPSSPSEFYFADGCQSCYAAASAAVHSPSSTVSTMQPHGHKQEQHHQHQRRRRRAGPYSRSSRGSPSTLASSSSSCASTLTTDDEVARFHRIPSSVNSIGNSVDQRLSHGYRKAGLTTLTKNHLVKMETGTGADAADLQDGYANPAIAAAAKTPPRNGRQQMLLQRNKISPPSADVVSMATTNGQRVAHIGHSTPKEARLTVSLEDVLRKTTPLTSTDDQWLPSMLQRQLQLLQVDVGCRQKVEKDKEEERQLRTHNGSLTRSKALELAGNNGFIKRVHQSRSKFIYKRSNLMPSPSPPPPTITTRQSTGRSSGSVSLLLSQQQQLSPTTRSCRSQATSAGPSIKRLSVPCLKWTSNEASTQSVPPRIKASKRMLRYSNGWTFEGSPSQKSVYLTNDDPPVIRWCFPSMRHEQGDVIRPRDCILLKSGPRKADVPYVAKVAAIWENPDDGEMMVSLLWYYRPEHTEQGRRPHHMIDEIFASKHRDVSSVACIEDKCYVLTFNEYCRYKCRIRILDEGTRPNLSVIPDLDDGYPRKDRHPPGRIAPELILFCRKVYDFRQKRILKNPS